MPQTASTANYNRADMAAMLSALPREEQQWTWDFLNSIIFMPELYAGSKDAVDDPIPELPDDILMTALELAEKSVAAGSCVRNDEIEDFVAKKMGWN